jgi:hypothetical protein
MKFTNISIVEKKKNYKSLNMPQTQTLQPNDTSNKLCNKKIHPCKSLHPCSKQFNNHKDQGKKNDKTPYIWQVSMHSEKNGKFVKHNNAMQKYVKMKSSKIVEPFQCSMVINQIIP